MSVVQRDPIASHQLSKYQRYADSIQVSDGREGAYPRVGAEEKRQPEPAAWGAQQ